MRANKELPGTTEGGPFTHRHTHKCAIYAFFDRVRGDAGSFLAYSMDLGDLREISHERITSDEFIKCGLFARVKYALKLAPNSNINHQESTANSIFANGIQHKFQVAQTKGHETLLENDSN